MAAVSEMRIVASLASLYVFRMLGLFMVFPVMMIYGRDYIDQTPFLLGMALGLYGLTQALFQIPLGLLSDFWGRKTVIALGFVVFAVGSLVAAMSDSVWGLMIGRALQGAGAVSGAILALVGDLTSEQNRTRAMAMIGASIGLSFAVALFSGPMLAAWGGLASIFWVTAGLAMIGLVILWRAIPAPIPLSTPVSSEGLAVPRLLGQSLLNPTLLRLNVGILILHLVLTATFVGVPLQLDAAGKASDEHWHFYLPVMLLAFIAMMPFMFIAERKRKAKSVIIGAIVALALSLIALVTQTVSSLWLLSLLCFFTAFNLLEATLPSWLSKQAPAGGKGTAMGVYSTCQFLGASLGGVLGGYIAQYQNLDAIFWLCALACGLWAIIACFMQPPAYLKSLSVHQAAPLDCQPLMAKVAGVVECAWVEEQQRLFLKVNDHFDQAQLDSYLLDVSKTH